MLSGVETPGCFLRGAGRAAQGCCKGGLGAPSPLPLRFVPGTFIPKAGDLWSCRTAQPAVPL